MNKKYLAIAIVIIILLLIPFFYPKTNGIWDDSFTAHTRGQYKNMDCTCIGFTAMKPGLSRSATQIQLCYGIPTNCVYTCKKDINGTWQEIDCSRLQ